uniref:CSON001845 protein n=1 Tax=Culicoides sonorensis TaxID=179676 RepID=A0A336MHL7_CULSO
MVTFIPHNTTQNLNSNDDDSKLQNFRQLNTSTKDSLTTVNNNSEARGATYSYYYISRRVWYIPLWFLFYFCFYILGLIIRSIILHRIRADKVEVVNQRMIHENYQVNTDVVNDMTGRVLDYIEQYQQKYKKLS